MPAERVIDVEVERLLVEDRRGGALVLVGPAADLDHPLHERDGEFGVLLGHDVGAGDGGGDVGHLEAPVRVPRQVLDRRELARRLRQLRQGAGLHVHRVDDALLERRLQRPECQIVLVVAPQPQLRRVLHERAHHLGLVVPVVRVGELDDIDVLARHAVHPEHELDALLLLDAPPVGLDGVLAPRQADLLALEVRHPVDVVAGAHQHDAAFARGVRHAKEARAADVGHDVDGREEAAEADHVVEVVDVVRVPVVLGLGTEIEVVDAELLVLLLGPAQFLVDVARRDQRAVRVVDLVPVQVHRAQLLALHHHLRHVSPLLVSAASPDRR